MLHEQASEQAELYGRVNISALSRETGYDRKTVRKYLHEGTKPPEQQHRNKPSKLDPYKDYLLKRLSDFPLLSCATLLEEIQSMGFTGKRTILGDYIHAHRPLPPSLPEWRYETKPGVQSQVDWAECRYNLPDGIIRKVYCFTMILGYSRMRYDEFTRSTDQITLLRCLQNAFEFFGGVTKEILFDNIRTVVLKRKYPSSESDFHPAFIDFRDHYGFIARLCRPYRAKTKGKIERVVHFVKHNFLYGNTFNSFEDLNRSALQWLKKVNNREHGTTHEIPSIRLLSEELTPIKSFPQYHISCRYDRKISKDCYISLYGNRYSVPWHYANQQAEVQLTNNDVVIKVRGEPVCIHRLMDGRYQVSRLKEHFEGLLKAVRDEPILQKSWQKTPELKFDVCSVEKRTLDNYDLLSGGKE